MRRIDPISSVAIGSEPANERDASLQRRRVERARGIRRRVERVQRRDAIALGEQSAGLGDLRVGGGVDVL
jgi:hypothetical protein